MSIISTNLIQNAQVINHLLAPPIIDSLLTRSKGEVRGGGYWPCVQLFLKGRTFQTTICPRRHSGLTVLGRFDDQSTALAEVRNAKPPPRCGDALKTERTGRLRWQTLSTKSTHPSCLRFREANWSSKQVALSVGYDWHRWWMHYAQLVTLISLLCRVSFFQFSTRHLTSSVPGWQRRGCARWVTKVGLVRAHVVVWRMNEINH